MSDRTGASVDPAAVGRRGTSAPCLLNAATHTHPIGTTSQCDIRRKATDAASAVDASVPVAVRPTTSAAST